jgi:hypothetical protein
VSKRSRRRQRTPAQPQLNPPKPPTTTTGGDGEAQPERMLLDQIAAGVLDMHLAAISDAIHARRELLHTISSAKALTMLNVGDRVRINHPARARPARRAGPRDRR